jgi:hypothetical protein
MLSKINFKPDRNTCRNSRHKKNRCYPASICYPVSATIANKFIVECKCIY